MCDVSCVILIAVGTVAGKAGAEEGEEAEYNDKNKNLI